MSNLYISQLPQTTTVTGPELIPLMQGGITKYSNASDIPLSAFKNTTLATTTQVAAVSAGLDTRTTYNANGVNTLFSTYTNSTTTQAISAGLQSQIDSINVVAGTNVTVNQIGKTWTVSSVGGGGGGSSWLPTQGVGMSITAPTTSSYLFSVNDYISGTQVAAISAGLNSRLAINEALDVTQTNSLNNLYSTYTNSTTTQAISAGIQSQINSINVVNLSAAPAMEVKTGNFTAVNQGRYVLTANATITDPTSGLGATYQVLIQAGSATIGEQLITAGALVFRSFNGTAWQTFSYGTLTTPVTTLTDPNGTGTVTVPAPSGPLGRFNLNYGPNAGIRTLDFTGLTAGASGIILVKQNSTGGDTLLPPIGAMTPNGSGIMISLTGSAISTVSYYYDGVTLYISAGPINWY